MLNFMILNAVLLSVVMSSVIMFMSIMCVYYTDCRHAECHRALYLSKFHFSVFQDTDSRYAERCYADCIMLRVNILSVFALRVSWRPMRAKEYLVMPEPRFPTFSDQGFQPTGIHYKNFDCFF
jgi:hypothetical protein